MTSLILTVRLARRLAMLAIATVTLIGGAVAQPWEPPSRDGGAVAQPWRPPNGFVESAPAASAELPAELVSRHVWTRVSDGMDQQIVESVPPRHISLKRYLALWRRDHGCTLRPFRGVATVAWADEQQTFSGSCEGGDVFAMHVVRLGREFFELHVNLRPGATRGGAPECFRPALSKLIAELERPALLWAPPRYLSRARTRGLIERLPMVVALGEGVRLRPLPDATEVVPGCTGSAGECMYWFRAERRIGDRWAFFRLFGVDPYDGSTFVSTSADPVRAWHGDYQAVGRKRRKGS